MVPQSKAQIYTCISIDIFHLSDLKKQTFLKGFLPAKALADLLTLSFLSISLSQDLESENNSDSSLQKRRVS